MTAGPARIEKSLSREASLTWLDEQTLEMKLRDNTTHQIPLTVAENIPGIIDPCLFSGTIVGDPESLVSVSGCKGNDAEVSIASKKLLGGLADLSLEDGQTYQITFHETGEKISAKKNRTRRDSGLEESTVKLTWERAMEIDAVFADGAQDKIQLQPVSNLPGETTPCLFTGTLQNDQDSVVTIDGCRGGRRVHVEILSKMAPAGVLELIIMNGRTYKAAPDNTTWRTDDVFDMPDKPGQVCRFAAQPRLVGPLPVNNMSYMFIIHPDYSEEKNSSHIIHHIKTWIYVKTCRQFVEYKREYLNWKLKV